MTDFTTSICGNGGFQTPLLKAAATAKASGGCSNYSVAVATGIQGYTYNGPGTQRSLNVRLTGHLYDPGNKSRGKIKAEVAIFEATDFNFGLDLATLVYERSARLEETVTGAVDRTETFTIDARDGDQFDVYVHLVADGISYLAGKTS